jgi:hypothetical protein
MLEYGAPVRGPAAAGTRMSAGPAGATVANQSSAAAGDNQQALLAAGMGGSSSGEGESYWLSVSGPLWLPCTGTIGRVCLGFDGLEMGCK